MTKQRVDAIVIGSGQGGKPLAADLARDGQKVVVFERGAWGGSCDNYGCTPSKAFLASAHAVGAARRASDLGVRAEVVVDFPAVMARVRDIIASWSQGSKSSLEDAGVQLVEAEAAFVGERTVEGGGETFSAPLVVIDTGMSPLIPPIPGLEGTPYLTYKSFWQLEDLPWRTIIVGSGYVGTEIGQAMARLGSQTHIIDRKDRPVATEELDVSKILGETLYHDGVRFHFSVEVREVAYADDLFTVHLTDGETLQGETLLMATGQRPNTQALNPAASGIELDDKGYVKVDDSLQTTCEGVYAIGDVIGQPAFTHVSWEDYRRLRSILNGGERAQGDRVLGYAFFTDPQVGRAGLTIEQAQEQGYDAEVVTLELEQVARASETGRTNGFYRMVIDKASDRILGATLVSPSAGELIHVFIAHMEAGSTWQVLNQSVHIHPTFAEGLPSLARLLK
jgi:dihydrolipoamide dehydrogenase